LFTQLKWSFSEPFIFLQNLFSKICETTFVRGRHLLAATAATAEPADRSVTACRGNKLKRKGMKLRAERFLDRQR
jgi:hypothetical protein